MIPNPEYKPNPNLYAYDSFKYVAIEIWQVKSGSIFDNILLTDSLETAEEWAAKWEARKTPEKEARDKLQEEERKAEEEKRKAEEAAKKEEEKDDEEEEDKDEL